MRPEILHALQNDFLIDLTTFGRNTGRPHTIECRFMYENGKVYVSGFPGKRDWLANVTKNPKVFIRLKQSIDVAIAAEGRVVTSEKERRPLLARYMEFWTPINPVEKALRFVVISLTKFWVKTRLPLWGPMLPISRIMKKMPLVEFTLLEEVAQSKLTQ